MEINIQKSDADKLAVDVLQEEQLIRLVTLVTLTSIQTTEGTNSKKLFAAAN